jgi:hypothetical protein
MDLMAAIQAFRSSPEQVRARQARRELREQYLYSRLGQAVGRPSAFEPSASQQMLDEADRLSRTAAGWNLPVEEAFDDGQSIGNQHPGAAALLIVRKVLSEFEMPTSPDLRYHGMKRASGHGASGMSDGIVYVQATLHSLSGPRHFVDIPVIIREGRVLAPSILEHNGQKRIITQHTFDDILGMGEFTARLPDRPNMFAPPPDKDASGRSREVPRLHPGMYKALPSRTLIGSAVRGFYQPDAFGVVENGALGRDVPGAGGSHLDVAERPTKDMHTPGQRVRMKREHQVRGRDGIGYTIPRGARGKVIRDMDGAGRVYYVYFEDLGFKAQVPGEAMSG